MTNLQDNQPGPATADRWRIARVLAAAGLGSRRKCEDLVTAGRVTVNGETIATPACSVDRHADDIRVDGRALSFATPRYLLLNKPRGYTCSARDIHAKRLVFEIMPQEFGRLLTVGRLDCDSEGLLLLTNDGDFVHRLAHPRFEVAKTYRVWAKGVATPDILDAWRAGVENAGETLRIAEGRIECQGPLGAMLTLVLKQGRKREIRRLCQASRLCVTRLQRVAYGPLRLGDLTPGQWRDLTAAEIAALLAGTTPPAPGNQHTPIAEDDEE